MPNTAITKGAHHIGLTVPDIEPTRQFFTGALGFTQVGEVPDYPAVFLTDGVTMITLWGATDPATATLPADARGNWRSTGSIRKAGPAARVGSRKFSAGA